jgi:hypothetical protein
MKSSGGFLLKSQQLPRVTCASPVHVDTHVGCLMLPGLFWT